MTVRPHSLITWQGKNIEVKKSNFTVVSMPEICNWKVYALREENAGGESTTLSKLANGLIARFWHNFKIWIFHYDIVTLPNYFECIFSVVIFYKRKIFNSVPSMSKWVENSKRRSGTATFFEKKCPNVGKWKSSSWDSITKVLAALHIYHWWKNRKDPKSVRSKSFENSFWKLVSKSSDRKANWIKLMECSCVDSFLISFAIFKTQTKVDKFWTLCNFQWELSYRR